MLRNKVNNNKKNMRRNLFIRIWILIIVSDSQNNDKRRFWKVIRHFVKSNSSASSIPPLCSTLQNGNNQWHFNDLHKANCLNDYFTSISNVNDEHTD